MESQDQSSKDAFESGLKKQPVAVLKKILSEYNKDVKVVGYSKMKKGDLVAAIMEKLGDKKMRAAMVSAIPKGIKGVPPKKGAAKKVAAPAAAPVEEVPTPKPVGKAKARLEKQAAAASAPAPAPVKTKMLKKKAAAPTPAPVKTKMLKKVVKK
jgi:hypothetical protein